MPVADCRRTPRHNGFTLIEAMVALSLTAMAGAAVLLTIETSLEAGDQAHEQIVAAGMAEQLLDEVVGAMYVEPGADPTPASLGPSNWESQGDGRERFNDNGDYHGFVAQPPEDAWGQPLGDENDAGGLRHANFRAPSGSFARWRQCIRVYYVAAGNFQTPLAAGRTSNFRAVEVVIERELADGEFEELARRRRVISYLPSAP